ncbi:MAG: YitT family protein [Cytophagaceae bacterium]|jgi:uncharacterized membrane-anchored protein YitT (DUF2179 family)|nr:YitT family protein [Cytophagaceae bacterium]
MTLKDIRKEIQSYILITAGLIIATFGWAAFIIPAKVVGGGITGISTIVHYTLGWDVGFVSLALNAILILVATKIIGKSFGIKTIYTVGLFSLSLSFISKLISVHNGGNPLIEEKMMATLTGSILAGFGGSLIILNGASAGGTEIIALIIGKYKNISFGRLLLSLDSVIIASSFFVFQSIEVMVYGFMAMAIFSYTVDIAISGTKQTVQMFIFSKKHEELREHILNVIQRGLTVIPAQGGFTKEPIDVIMVIVRKSESPYILKLIKQTDPDAFITMGNVMGVYGKGFDTIKL